MTDQNWMKYSLHMLFFKLNGSALAVDMNDPISGTRSCRLFKVAEMYFVCFERLVAYLTFGDDDSISNHFFEPIYHPLHAYHM